MNDTARIIKMMTENGDIDMYTASSYIKKLKTQGNMDEYAKGFIMYFEDIDKIISSVGYYDSRTFFAMYFTAYDGDYEQWKKEMFYNGSSFFGIGNIFEPKMYHSAGIYYPEAKNSKVRFLTEINNDAILKNLDLLNKSEDEIYFVADNSGKLLWQMGGTSTSYEKINEGKGDIKIDGVTYSINSASFKYYGMKISYAVERKKVFNQVIVAHRYVLICSMLCIIIGISLIYVFMRKNYSEINAVLELLECNNDTDGGNEMEVIKKEIMKQKETNLKYKSILARQRYQVANYTTMRILKGVNESIDNLFVNLNSTPVSDRFSVAVLSAQNKEIADVIAELIHDSLNGVGNRVFYVDFEGYKAFVVNCVDYSVDNIEEDFKYALTYAKETLGSGFCAVISDICETVAQVSTEYEHIKKVIQQFEMSGEECVFVDAKDKLDDRNCYYYPLQLERQLINAINTGDISNVRNLIESVYCENFDKMQLDIEIVNCLFNNMLGTLINTIKANNLTDKNDELNPTMLIHRLHESKKVNEMKELISNIAQICCECLRNEAERKHSSKMDDILAYIHNNYSDADMNVFYVADKFNVSSTAMSKMFKKEMNMGMLEYINIFRLNKATQLLVSTDKSISEIAESVGCGNYRTFARLFAKQYGITAKQYREINK
ncbi:MAG: helix-turn-helix transcriptional regulator [Clostridia bacterium]|nr:helix-turn-helix transcriptional regulator [Clostridia bacterium]